VRGGNVFILIFCTLAVLSAAQKTNRKTKETKLMALEMKSSAFSNNKEIPKKFTCDGADVSPALSWTNSPQGTRSFALVMDDPDAPPGTWVHWVLYDLPSNISTLQDNIPKKETLPSGAKQGLCWGVADDEFDRVGYYGPCPPPGKPHRYFFKLYALDKVLGLPPKSTKSQLVHAMEGHIIAQSELIGLYKR